ncbi:alpha/beta-type small acid-soluble spore protein [Clostridium magnum]|uniref:Small, acid-soluble spore protein C2 n=1 Tax=Clostridium magnum DSM 2767 TaxID=1121326 RepID=A0A162RG30_9CLOT|nr:alpha/beta-type small acid-soluble spore protein [Clostridium magnum]KZL89851.1 small, acid-soluble spore protein C2 [Clostridium magnum DSM 2767]SHI48130.1 Small, acid-soluble spore protein, alpha/beta type [Clostridium magnum DSM 2767]
MDNKYKKQNYAAAKETAKTKTELANELGIPVPKDGYWGNMTAKTCGTVGGAVGGQKVKAAIESFERSLLGDPEK